MTRERFNTIMQPLVQQVLIYMHAGLYVHTRATFIRIHKMFLYNYYDMCPLFVFLLAFLQKKVGPQYIMYSSN